MTFLWSCDTLKEKTGGHCMEPVLYHVIKINGDYAIMKTEDGIENTVAMALLPMEIAEGDTVLWENFTYSIIKS